MNADWERQKALFLAAIEAATKAQRDRLLANAPADDRSAVESLLEAHRTAPPRLAETIAHSGLLEAITGSAQHGRRLGQWTLEQPLGLGPLGHTFRAHDGEGQRVVLEVVEGEGQRAGLAAALEPIAQRLLEIEHPGLARTLAVGRTGETLWVAHEDIAAAPRLARAIDRACDLEMASIATRVARVAEAADALAALHGYGVLHRDLSVHTVCVASDGRVLLADVGLRGLVPAGLPRATTAASAPELAHSAGTTAADIWSLGVVLFTLLVGASPASFAAAVRPSEALAGLDAARRVEVARRRDTSPEELPAAVARFDALVTACLDSDPQRRPATAEELAAALRR